MLLTTCYGGTTRKMVVVREEGQIEKSEEITRKCFQFYVYLALHVINQKNFSFDTTQAVKSQHEPLIQAFQTMVTDLTPILSTDEQEAMEFHLYYLQEVYRLSVLIADLSKALLTYGKQQEELNDDTLSSTQMAEIIENTKKCILLRDQLESILIEDGESARATVKSILKKRHYKKQLRNRHERRKVFKEMNDATYASRKYIKACKQRYKKIEGTLESNKVMQT